MKSREFYVNFFKKIRDLVQIPLESKKWQSRIPFKGNYQISYFALFILEFKKVTKIKSLTIMATFIKLILTCCFFSNKIFLFLFFLNRLIFKSWIFFKVFKAEAQNYCWDPNTSFYGATVSTSNPCCVVWNNSIISTFHIPHLKFISYVLPKP
jgi:hypothetical protein